jgi:hypothetical protein
LILPRDVRVLIHEARRAGVPNRPRLEEALDILRAELAAGRSTATDSATT